MNNIQKLEKQTARLAEAMEAMNDNLYIVTEDSPPIVLVSEKGWIIFNNYPEEIGKKEFDLIKLMKEGMGEGWDKEDMETAIAQTEKLIKHMKRDYRKYCGPCAPSVLDR
jgi:hypothetical protein